jgi:hypothetical protein
MFRRFGLFSEANWQAVKRRHTERSQYVLAGWAKGGDDHRYCKFQKPELPSPVGHPSEVFFDQLQGQIYTTSDPSRGIDVAVPDPDRISSSASAGSVARTRCFPS